jgi:hypothetical protein
MMRYVGALVALAGVLAVAYGIGLAIGQAEALSEDAVARGTVDGERVAFESAEPKLTVYLDTDGIANSETKDRMAGATGCVVTADGFEDSFRGNVQGASATLGDYVSVGSFTLPGSSGRITCSGASSIPYLVTPVGAGAVFKAVGVILAGAFGAAGGIVLLVVGFRRRRRSARAEQVGPQQVHESGNW